jgi:polyvinyl alcohol dehydrogenase (cytochrome)
VFGGIEWGTAADGQRIYVPIGNWYGEPYGPSNAINGGSWAALDQATGAIEWQTATPGKCSTPFGTPQNCMALSAASVANGVVFAGSMDSNFTNPTMFGLDAGTGKILWSFAAQSTVVAAPAIVGDSVYWGSGSGPILAEFGIGTLNNKLYAFSVK